MSTAGIIATICLLALGFGTVVVMTRKRGALTVTLNDGQTESSYVINPWRAFGDFTLAVAKVDHAVRWQEKGAKAARSFLQRKSHPYKVYAGSIFALRVENGESNSPKLIGMYLPLGNLKGTYRDSIELATPLDLLCDTAYRVSLSGYPNYYREIVFKITGGLLFLVKD